MHFSTYLACSCVAGRLKDLLIEHQEFIVYCLDTSVPFQNKISLKSMNLELFKDFRGMLNCFLASWSESLGKIVKIEIIPDYISFGNCSSLFYLLFSKFFYPKTIWQIWEKPNFDILSSRMSHLKKWLKLKTTSTLMIDQIRKLSIVFRNHYKRL